MQYSTKISLVSESSLKGSPSSSASLSLSSASSSPLSSLLAPESSSTTGRSSLTWSSSEPSRALEIPQMRNELTIVSCLSPKLLIPSLWHPGEWVASDYPSLSSLGPHASSTASSASCFHGLLMHLSIGCTIEVHPPGMMMTSELHRSSAILIPSCDR